MKRSRLAVLVSTLLIVSIAGALVYTKLRPATPIDPPRQSSQSAPHENRTIRLVASGDMLAHDSVNQQARTAAGYDYRQFLSPVEQIYKAADIRFCNLEVPTAGEALGISGYPTFNAPTQFSEDIAASGCNVLSLANNHLYDKGQAGIDRTREVWDRLKPLAVAGANRTPAEQDSLAYFEVEGMRFAFLAYTEISNNPVPTKFSLNMLDETLVRAQLATARQEADVVLVGVHWGTEYSSEINQAQERWAKIFADSGADIVLGTGPHVLQPVERISQPDGSETLVWYSLGNLLSTQLELDSLIGGFAVMDFDIEKKALTSVSFLPTYMHYEWTAQERDSSNLLARRNLGVHPLDQAAPLLARSLHTTSVEAQTERLKLLLNRRSTVPLITSATY